MFPATSLNLADAPGDEPWALEALRLEGLQPAILVALAAGYGGLAYLGATDSDLGTFLVAIGILASAIAAIWLHGRSPRAAARLLVGGLLVSLGLALRAYPSLGLAALLAPVVALAGVLLDRRSGALVTIAAAALIVASLGWPGPDEPLDVIYVGIAVCSGLPMGWLLTRPARMALSWAWHSYDQALRTTEELRDRQGELARLSKSLAETCYRLECVNRELEEARRGAEEARRLKSQFAASISHELRTPLNLIIGFSEMMVLAPSAYQGERLPDRYRGDIEAIYRNACHLSDLVDDVLELSQIDANRLGLTKEWASLAEIVEEATAAVASMFRDKGLALVTHVPADLPPLFVDRTRIRQVLINLLNNAARFTDEGGVRIAAQHDANDVIVSVTDTGVGIAPGDLPRVFDEFSQLRTAGARSSGGSGLGLTITKRFVELHGGNIWVESRPGLGSTFRFTLPLCDSVAALPPQPNWAAWVPAPSGADGARTVLVLGDDPDPPRILQRHLDGYRVVPAPSLQDARRQDLLSQARAVIATSPAAASEWRRAQAASLDADGIPLICCTWRTRRELRDNLGVADYLVKPVNRDAIKASLSRLGRHVRDLVVVDDDPEMLRLLGQIITSISRRYRVRLAGDGAAALTLLRQNPPDALVLDLVMPGLDGYAVLEEMRADERLAGIPVVVVTAKGAQEETIVATGLSVTRGEGLSVAETVRFLKASLDGLVRPA